MSMAFSAADAEHRVVAQLVAGQVSGEVVLTISSADEVYQRAAEAAGGREQALLKYFRAALQASDAVRQLVAWHFGPKPLAGGFLEIVPGYGDTTRFFAAEYGPDQVCVSELLPEARAFHTSEFKVAAIPFSDKPEAFKPGRLWDCIYVGSLLNSLPEREFTRWLWKFHSLLAPGGLLIIVAGSDPSPAYIGFVHNAIIAVTSVLDHAWVPFGHRFTHDLYAIPKGPLRKEPFRFQYGPNGSVDFCRWTEPEQMRVSGWAYDATQGESITRVDAYYNGVLRGTGHINHYRPDIAASLGKLQGAFADFCGWDCTIKLTGERIQPTQDWLLVKAVSSSGREFALGLSHPSHIGKFEEMEGWAYDETLGKSQAILPVVRFVDYPVNGRFTSQDGTFSGWVATKDPDDLEQIALVGHFGNVPYQIVQRPDVFAELQLPALGFAAVLPPEYLTISDQSLRFVTRSGVVLTAFETVVDNLGRT